MFFSSSAPLLLCLFASSYHLWGSAFSSLLFCFPFFFEERRQTCCFFFFFCQAGKRDVGRDCSAKSAAAECERKLLMNECQSFAVARCSWGHFTWMVSGCAFRYQGDKDASSRLVLRRLVGFPCCPCCFFSLTYLLRKHAIHSVFFKISFM